MWAACATPVLCYLAFLAPPGCSCPCSCHPSGCCCTCCLPESTGRRWPAALAPSRPWLRAAAPCALLQHAARACAGCRDTYASCSRLVAVPSPSKPASTDLESACRQAQGRSCRSWSRGPSLLGRACGAAAPMAAVPRAQLSRVSSAWAFTVLQAAWLPRSRCAWP